MDIEKFETIKDFQRAFLVLANACVKKFGGDKAVVLISENDDVSIEFK